MTQSPVTTFIYDFAVEEMCPILVDDKGSRFQLKNASVKNGCLSVHRNIQNLPKNRECLEKNGFEHIEFQIAGANRHEMNLINNSKKWVPAYLNIKISS